MEDPFYFVKMEGNGYFNFAQANNVDLKSGKYDIKMPDGTVLLDKDIRVEKHMYTYSDHGKIMSAYHQRAFMDVEVYGMNVEVDIKGLRIALKKELKT